MSIHIYKPACPATSQALCTCPSISSLVPGTAAKFQADLLHCAVSPTSSDHVPPVIYLPSNPKRPVNEFEFRAYVKTHKLEPPLRSNHCVKTALPVDLKSFESRWQHRIMQRPPAPRWPAICTACNKGSISNDALLCCHDCGLSIHALCRGPFVNPKKFSSQFYLCESCTFCNFCSRKDNQHLTKICDTCTGTWHVYCLQLPHSRIHPLSQVSSRYFRCKRCTDAPSNKVAGIEVVQTSTLQSVANGNKTNFNNADMEVDSDDTLDQDETSSDED